MAHELIIWILDNVKLPAINTSYNYSYNTINTVDNSKSHCYKFNVKIMTLNDTNNVNIFYMYNVNTSLSSLFAHLSHLWNILILHTGQSSNPINEILIRSFAVFTNSLFKYLAHMNT